MYSDDLTKKVLSSNGSLQTVVELTCIQQWIDLYLNTARMLEQLSSGPINCYNNIILTL